MSDNDVNNVDLTRKEYFECVCHSEDHMFRVEYHTGVVNDRPYKELYVLTQIGYAGYVGFWYRLKAAWKVFTGGWQHWQETILRSSDIERLEKLLAEYKNLPGEEFD